MKKVVARSKKLKVPRKSALKKQTARDTTKKTILYLQVDTLSSIMFLRFCHILGISRAYHRFILGKSKAHLGHMAYIRHILDISWTYLGRIFDIS